MRPSRACLLAVPTVSPVPYSHSIHVHVHVPTQTKPHLDDMQAVGALWGLRPEVLLQHSTRRVPELQTTSTEIQIGSVGQRQVTLEVGGSGGSAAYGMEEEEESAE